MKEKWRTKIYIVPTSLWIKLTNYMKKKSYSKKEGFHVTLDEFVKVMKENKPK